MAIAVESRTGGTDSAATTHTLGLPATVTKGAILFCHKAVADIMGGHVEALRKIPIVAPSGRPTIRRGNVGDAVLALKVLLRIDAVSSEFDAVTEAATRAFQRTAGLVADGIVGPKTWAALDARN